MQHQKTDMTESALDVQVGGSHYKDMAIQPVKYIHANQRTKQKTMAIHYKTILTAAGIIAAMGIAGQLDYEEEQRQAEQYCEMVRLWKQTHGRAGWPAYDGEEVCRASRAERDTAPTNGQKE